MSNQRQRPRRGRVPALMILISLLLVACGAATTATPTPAPAGVLPSGTNAAPASTTVSTTAEGAQVPGESASLPANYNKKNTTVKGTVRLGTFEGGDSIAKLTAAIKAFNQEYPDVEVKVEAVPSDYGTKLLNQIAAGTPPDVFQIGDGDARLFVDRGGAEDLSPFFHGEYGLDQSIFYPSVLDIGKVDGKQYYLPKGWTGIGIFYNKQLWSASGVQPPANGDWTWDQFIEIAKKLTLKDKQQWGVGFWNEISMRGMYPLILGAGGDYISEDGTKIQGVLDSEATIKGYNFLNDLTYKYEVAPDQRYIKTNGSTVELFEAGKLGMLYLGIWPLNDWTTTKPLDFEWGTLPLPHFPGKPPRNAIFWSGYAMSKQSANKNAAWELLKFLSGPDGGRMLEGVAVQTVAAERMQKDARVAPFISIAAPYFTPLPEFRTRFFNDSVAKYTVRYVDDAALAGEHDFGDALRRAAADAQKELDRLRAQTQ